MKLVDLHLVRIGTQTAPSASSIVPSTGEKVGYGVVMHRSSVYIKLIVPSWTGLSLVYLLKRIGGRTLPCGRPFF